PEPAEVWQIDEEVRRMRRGAALAAARAVAVRDRAGAGDLVCDAAAETAPANLPGDGFRATLERNRIPHAGRKIVEARKGVGDRMPRRLGRDEDVGLGTHPGTVVAKAGRAEDDRVGRAGQGGATASAERAGAAGRGLVATHALAAA